MSPNESLKHNDICPACKRKLTIGVLHRVEELADRPEGFVPDNHVPFNKLVPLSEIISRILNSGISSQKVWKEYNNIVNSSRSEIDVLLNLSLDELNKLTDEKIAEAIIRIRNQGIKIKPGFDGEYGYPLFNDKKKDIKIKDTNNDEKNQKDLNESFK
jgi:PHP family Zn ribbon phosphoesterase